MLENYTSIKASTLFFSPDFYGTFGNQVRNLHIRFDDSSPFLEQRVLLRICMAEI